MTSSQQQRRWHLYPDRDALELALAHRLAAAAAAAIRQRGEFHIVLAGGSTPMGVYRRLAAMPADWSHWHIYFGDERCLPVGDADRNDSLVRQHWLSRVAIPESQIFAIAAELGPETAARRYSDTLAGVDLFDLVLLGVGEDGHTASLFPGLTSPAGDDPAALPVYDAPKPPPRRVTLSAQRLGRAREVRFMVSGRGKAEALGRWHRDQNLPASWIRPAGGVDIDTDIDPATDPDSRS